MRRPVLAAAALALAAAAAACASDTYGEPVPGHEALIILGPGTAPFRGTWPVSFRRGAEFAIENRTGVPVETLILDFGADGGPRELDRITIVDPPGKTALILPTAHGLWPLRARLGDAGTVLLEPGGTLHILVHVMGSPGASRVKVTIPGVTVE